MNASELDDLLAASEVSRHADYLRTKVRPKLDLLRNGGTLERGSSRFNGAPDLPRGFRWPEHETGPYRFLGQFNFGEMPAATLAEVGAPTSGLLSIFQQFEECDEIYWGEPDYVRGFYFAEGTALTPLNPPAETKRGEVVSVGYSASVDLPEFSVISKPKIADWPLTRDEADAYERQIRNLLHHLPNRSVPGESDEEALERTVNRIFTESHYLFGYQSNASLGYDPTPDAGWGALITLLSDDELDTYWHDSSWLMTFVEHDKLRRADFGEIKTEAG